MNPHLPTPAAASLFPRSRATPRLGRAYLTQSIFFGRKPRRAALPGDKGTHSRLHGNRMILYSPEPEVQAAVSKVARLNGTRASEREEEREKERRGSTATVHFGTFVLQQRENQLFLLEGACSVV